MFEPKEAGGSEGIVKCGTGGYQYVERKVYLIKKKQQLSIQINDLQRTKDAISRTIYSLERYRKSPPSGTITLEYIDRRRIYVMHTNINFYEHDLNVYEYLLTQLKNDLIMHHYPQIYYCNAGLAMSGTLPTIPITSSP